MANKNAPGFVKNIPECMKGCFDVGIAATGCKDGDYDCWCYNKNHETVVDNMYECLGNRIRKTGKNCTEQEYFDMEQNYWKICEQYWETYGTAKEPASVATSPPSGASTFITSTAPVLQTTPGTKDSTPSDASQAGNSASTQHQLSAGAKAGIGIGVALGVIILAVLAFLLLRERKRRKTLENQVTTIQAYVEEKKSPYTPSVAPAEMPGCEPWVPELRGDTLAGGELRGDTGANELRGDTAVEPSPQAVSPINEFLGSPLAKEMSSTPKMGTQEIHR